MTPAPASNTASRVASSASAGTNQTSFTFATETFMIAATYRDRGEISMRRAILGVAGLFALVVAAVAAAAAPVNASSPGTPFSSCTTDQAALQTALFGSVNYPGSEIEPRSAINPRDPNNIVGEYQQDRWSDGGSRGLVA